MDEVYWIWYGPLLKLDSINKFDRFFSEYNLSAFEILDNLWVYMFKGKTYNINNLNFSKPWTNLFFNNNLNKTYAGLKTFVDWSKVNVMKAVKSFGMHFSKKRCQFLLKEINFQGYVIKNRILWSDSEKEKL